MRDLRAALLLCASFCASLAACSGGAPASDPPAPPATEVSSPQAPTTPPPTAAEAPAEAAPGVSSVVAAVLDSRPMTMYLHPEVEGRVPVAIAGPALAGATIEAVAQGQPVKVLSDAEAAASPDAPCVLFDGIDLGPSTATVELRYPVEGIVGRFLLEREGEGWRIVKAELAER